MMNRINSALLIWGWLVTGALVLNEDFEFTCDFEDGTTCAFENTPNESNGRCSWVIRKGPGASLNTGPSSDHTLKNIDGMYLYFQASKCVMDNSFSPAKAELTTKNLLANFQETAQCLKFWYHMYGAPDVFRVYVYFINGRKQLEFMRKNNQGDRWISADVTINNANKMKYHLLFEAFRGNSHLGDVALDDISIRDGACFSSKDLCDFENLDLCNFRTVISNDSPNFEWKFGKTQELFQLSPQGIDHTFLSTEGHAAYVSGTNVIKNAKTYMISPPQTIIESMNQCITFWYQVPVFPNGGKLQVYVIRANQDNVFIDPVWSVGDGFKDSWEYGAIPVTIGEDFKFVFEAWNDVSSFFVLDDIIVLKEKCPEPLTCDFEDGLCGWTNEFHDNFDWIVFQGASNNGEGTGPSVDHTLNSTAGHYIFVDSDYSNQMNYETAELVSQRVQVLDEQPTNWCFMFWYHMYIDPQSNASLELVLRQSNDNRTNLMVINSPQRNMWIQRTVEIPLVNGDFRLSFKVTVEGAHGKSNIALDDLSADNGECPEVFSSDFRCPDEDKVIERNQLCDQIKDCTSGADELDCGGCNFNSIAKLCGYSIFTHDHFTWDSMNFDFLTSSEDDSRPGASNSSGYMYADFSSGALRSSAYLDSPWLHQTSASCKITFWFNLDRDSSDSGTLIVLLQLEDTETTLAVIDQTLLNPGSTWAWQQYVIDLGRMSGEFRLVFRARKGMANDGFIALDEISLDFCNFPPPVHGECPGVGEWKCSETQICILDDQRCDFTDDCGNGEDERSCDMISPLRCNFEKDFCDWMQDESNDVDWLFTNGKISTNSHSGPLRDHTTGLQTGGFIYLKSSLNSETIPKKGKLLSVVLPPHKNENKCTLRFYYHMYGPTIGELIVWMVPENCTVCTAHRMLVLNNNYGNLWNRNSLHLFSDVPFRVMFEGIIRGNSSDIAIDDVSFTNNCRPAEFPTGLPPTPAETTALGSTTVLTTISTEPILISTTSQISLLTFSTLSTAPETIIITSTVKPTMPPTTISKTTVTPLGTTTPTPTTHLIPITASSSTQRTIDDPKIMPDLGEGAIAGIVVGAVACLFLAAGGLFFAVRKRRRTTGSAAGGAWSTSSYKNFGAVDGALADGADDMDNAVLNDKSMKKFGIFSESDMPGNVEFETHRGNSESGNDSIVSLPFAPARTRSKQRRNILSITLPGSSSSEQNKRSMDSRNSRENMPGSPGEIISESFNKMQNGSSSGRTDEEKYRDLNAADLVIIIDTQQALLDRLNVENRDFTVKMRNLQATFQALLEENDKLHAALNMKIKHANLDQILQQSSSEKDSTSFDEADTKQTQQQQIMASNLNRLETERSTLFKEKERLQEKLQFIKVQLTEKTNNLEETSRKLAERTDPKYFIDLEDLAQSLGNTVDKLRARESDSLEEVLGLKEQSTRLSAENNRLKDVVHHLETEIQTMRIEYDRVLKSTEDRHRDEMDQATRELRQQIEEKIQELTAVGDHLKELTTKFSEARAKEEAALQDCETHRRRAQNMEDTSAASLRQLATELAECRQQLSIAQEKHKADMQQVQSNMRHHTTRQRLNEDQLRDLRQRLLTAEAAWTDISQDKARLLLRNATLEDKITVYEAERIRERPEQSGGKHIDQWAWFQEELRRFQGLREKDRDMAVAVNEQAAGLFRSQTNLIEKFKVECETLLTKWDRAEKAKETILVRSKSLNAGLTEAKTANAL